MAASSIPQQHAHDAAHDAGPFRLRTYLIGFVASAVLTAIPFWIVMSGAMGDTASAVALIMTFAVAQILVHTVAFLHVNARAQGGWTLIAYVFTAVLLLITIAGSLWIMFHLNTNLMPGMPSEPPTSQMP